MIPHVNICAVVAKQLYNGSELALRPTKSKTRLRASSGNMVQGRPAKVIPRVRIGAAREQHAYCCLMTPASGAVQCRGTKSICRGNVAALIQQLEEYLFIPARCPEVQCLSSTVISGMDVRGVLKQQPGGESSRHARSPHRWRRKPKGLSQLAPGILDLLALLSLSETMNHSLSLNAALFFPNGRRG